jgi:hypothetical protein
MYDALLLLTCSWWERYQYLKVRTLRMVLRLAHVAATLEGARSLVLASFDKMHQHRSSTSSYVFKSAIYLSVSVIA